MGDRPPSLRDALHRAHSACRTLAAGLSELEGALDDALQASFETGLQQTLQDPSPVQSHRRHHRPGLAPKLATDPELRALVEARLGTMTFDQITAEVEAKFPPARRIRRSAIHAWWTRHHKRT